MTTAWDAWPTRSHSHPGSPSLSPLSRSPTKTTGSMAAASMSFSPASFDRSSFLSARMTPPPPANLPVLPPEILRRIIHHALALPPSIPAPFPNIDAEHTHLRTRSQAPFPADPQWDMFAARAARKALNQRAAQREAVMRTARSLIGVCRAWKQFVLSYLYAEPNINGDNVAALAHAVAMGDRKWSDINLHPHSTPGRWITTLDLSNVGSGTSYLGADSVTVARSCAVLLDLAPCITHLRLPSHGVKLTDLRLAPCIRKLRAIEGIHLATREDEEEAIKLLRSAKNLELVGLVWVGSVPTEMDMEMEFGDEFEAPPTRQIILPRLHTLTLVAGRPGPLLAALTRAELPTLSRLVTSPYESSLSAFDDDPERGGPRALQVAHGEAIKSLTYVSTPDWPRRDLLPPADTLAIHPNLLHLHLGLPHALLNEHPELGTALGSRSHTLAVLTLPRWPKVVAGADTSPGPVPTQFPPSANGPPPPGNNAFLTTLCAANPSIKVVAVDGFTWVAPALGRWAAESGDSGMMRQWSIWLQKHGIELRDQEGNVAPIIERGRGSFSSGFTGFGVGMTPRRSVDGGRRSFDSGWPR